ncbi:MAG: hypothetical protein QOK15_1031 [Nocardioidaceae bacterium]|nr:hypothetical protein [Nocardioidaceae bacterium]
MGALALVGISPTQREAIHVVFQSLNRYLGVAVGATSATCSPVAGLSWSASLSLRPPFPQPGSGS